MKVSNAFCFVLIACFTLPTNIGAAVSTINSSTPQHTLSYEVKQEFNCSGSTLIEEEYVVLQNGSLIVPQSTHIYQSDSFIVSNNTAYICIPPEELEEGQELESLEPTHNFSVEFLKCGHIILDPDEYELWKNGTVFIEIYNKHYDPTNYYLQEDGGLFVCTPNYTQMASTKTNAKFSDAFIYVSHVGMFISIISLVLHLIVFCALEKVRNLPGYCLASLSLSLLMAYLFFVSSSAAHEKEQCARVGLCVYFFFLASFFWMNTIAFDVWRSFRVFVSKMRITRNKVPWRKFLAYSAYSWFVPGVLAVFAEVSDSTEILPEEFRPSFGAVNCWFGSRKALLVFFAVPLCVVMFLNVIFFLDSSYVIHMTTVKTSSVNEMLLRQRFFMFMRLAVIMGLTWIVGIVAGYANNEVMWYIFVVLNTLQGLFIFIVFSCSAKVRQLVVKKIKGRRSTAGRSTSIRTISQMSNVL